MVVIHMAHGDSVERQKVKEVEIRLSDMKGLFVHFGKF